MIHVKDNGYGYILNVHLPTLKKTINIIDEILNKFNSKS